MRLVDLPPQDELRRRIKAARQLAGYTSTAELGAAIGEAARLGDRTLRKLEAGERDIVHPHLRVIAEACRLPIEFFTVPNVGMAVLAGATLVADPDDVPAYEPGSFMRTLADMQRRMTELEQAVHTAAADSDSTRAATNLTRRLKEAAAEAAGADATTEAADPARDGADATSESADTQSRGKRRSARGTGR